MASLIIAFHSGYGHTRRLVDAALEGVATHAGIEAEAIDVTRLDEAAWTRLDRADAIILACPTYMAGPSAAFKQFADQSSSVWIRQGWKDKLAGGMTCSLNMSGDKLVTLNWMVNFAMQHGMIWVGTGLMPPSQPGHPDELNRLGSSTGVMAQADNLPPEQAPPPGDLETAREFGSRIAGLLKKPG
ncbi:MAG: flavodoxin family protein [Burkholderiaceae bacterium]